MPYTSRPATASQRGKEVTVLGLLDDVQVELTTVLPAPSAPSCWPIRARRR